MSGQAKTGVSGVIARAVEDGAADLAARQGEQLGMFEPVGRPLTPDEAAAERRGGRPKGATSWKTREVADYLRAVGADPLQALARWLTVSPEEMAARLGVTVANAFGQQMIIARELMPYIHAKRAPVDDQGNVAPSIVFQIGGASGAAPMVAGGVAMPAWEADLIAQGVPVEALKNQGLSDATARETVADAENGGEKP